jgi:hypothetical protein
VPGLAGAVYGPIQVKHRRHKSLFGSFSSEKEQESSFSEEKEAKRLLCLVLLDVACQAMELLLAPATSRI